MKKILFIMLPVISLFGACKKNSNDVTTPAPDPGTSNARIKTRAGGSGVTTYSYNAQGRTVKEESLNGSKTEYEYPAGIVNEKYYDNGGVLQSAYINELNPDGTRFRVTQPGNPIYEELCFFNADKTLAKSITKVSANSTQVIDYFYSNGNCDSTRFSNNGNWNLTVKYTYYTDKLNGLSYDNFGYGILYGKDSKNLTKSEVYTYPDGSTNTPSNYSYEFDAQGRVSKETSTKGNNIGITIYTYY